MTIPWFEGDPAALAAVERTLRQRYPTMHALVAYGKIAIRGTYGVVHEGKEIDRYALSIVLPGNYPRSIPTVWETAERIPRIIDRHIFPKTGALCLGVPAALWIAMGGNFTIDRVLDIPIRNYLIGNSMVEAGEKWPYGEWKHGPDGILDFFSETIGKDPMKIGDLLVALLDGRVRGHWACPCGSGAIIRKCHREAIEQLRSVPEGMLAQSLMVMVDIVKSRQPRAA